MLNRLKEAEQAIRACLTTCDPEGESNTSIAPLLFFLAVQGLRQLHAFQRQGHAWARLAVPAIMLLHLATLPIVWLQYAREQPQGWQWQRQRLADQLN